MIIELQNNISTQDKEAILNKIESLSYAFTEVITQTGHYVVGKNGIELDKAQFDTLGGIKHLHYGLSNYKLVSRQWKTQATKIQLNNNSIIQDGGFSIIAGPCAIESEDQIETIIKHLADNNITMMRGGIFKPRTSPYSFQGLGLEGLKQLHNVASSKGIGIISEVMDISQIEEMYDYVSAFQIGARNSQNYNLLKALGKTNKPILLKRGISSTLDELLNSAEHIYSSGNEQIILCERGIRTYENAYRNTFDLNAVPVLKEKTHLPIIVDPSHGIGISRHIESMALAGVMAGADGILLEVHENPAQALSDGQQSIDFKTAESLYRKLSATYDLRSSFEA